MEKNTMEVFDIEPPSSTVFVVFGYKGGIAKTSIASTSIAMLREHSSRIAIVDMDTVNRQLAELEADVKEVDLRATEIRGPLQNLKLKFERGEIEHAVIDTPAGLPPETFNYIIEWFHNVLNTINVDLVVLMPVVLSSFVKNKAAEFIKTHPMIPVVLVENHSQGRTARHFKQWRESETYRECVALGAATAVMTDAGVEHGDEANGFGLTLPDIAIGNFAKADPDDLAELQSLFTDDVQAHLGLWLADNIENLRYGAMRAVRFQRTKRVKKP
jgi:hypothetical protein